jgi:hypothetical protein
MDDLLAAAARGERVAQPLDDATIAAAAAEGMAGLLARASHDPPRELQIVAAAIETRSAAMAAELARVLDACAAAGLRMLALKGPTASQQLYGHPGLRSFNDLDLITTEREADAAEALLRSLGYRDETAMSPQQRATKRRFHNGTALVNDERHAIVDLHWRFGHVQFPLALPFDGAWARRASVPVYGAAIAAPGTSDLAVFLCAHAAKHFWCRLELFAQIAALARLDADWDEIDRIAAAAHATRRVGLSFLLANDVIGSPLPPLPRCLAAARPPFPALRRLWREQRGRHWVRGRALSLILDRRRDLAGATAALIFVPTHADWAASRAPEPLQWLLRPFRIARARLRW